MDLNIIYIILAVIAIVCLIMFLKVKNKILRVLGGVMVSLCIIVTCAVSFSPLLDKIHYGIDLQGGFEILYQVSPLDDKEKLDSDMVYNTYKSLLKRIDILGVSEPEITIEGDDKIRVKLAGVTNKEEAREVLSSTASLTFRDTSNMLLMTSDVLGGNAKVTKDSSGKPAVSLSIKDKDKFYDVTNKISKTTNNVIVIWLDYQEGVDSYSKEKNNCGSLSDSRCLSAAIVSQGFASDVIISGNFTEEEVTSLVELINSGALPTKLTEVSSRTVEASFGANSLNQTLIAGIIGICLVIILMIAIYRFSGFIASMGLVLYTLLSFLVFYLINGVLTLPGIAAMLLGIGMAVDANVISFERVKENLKIGHSLKEAYHIGNKDSLSSIIDANITTMIVAVILFILGESSVKGFATMLIINIIVTVLIMVVFVKFVLRVFVDCDFFDDKLGMFIGFNKKKIVKSKEIIVPFKKLEFVRNRKFFLSITAFIIVVGIVLSCVRGANLGVDFTGGTTVTVNTNENVSLSKLKNDLKDMKYTIKKTSKTDDDVTVTIDEVLDKDEIKDLTNKLEEKYDSTTDIYVVSKIVKQELTKNAIYSLILASIAIVIYISLRFRFNYAVAGIVALLHDVTIVILFFCIFKIEITSIFIAAILTIIGYSINDTIVTFDMIRENYKTKYKNNIKKSEDLIDLVNDSVRLTIFRSILTTITTIIPVICLILFGAREILDFNIALLVGFIAGVYSSIYISNQLWLILEDRKIKKPIKPKKKDDDDEIEELKIKGVNC
jgi:protein-export membrane protein SecD/preprotein translocase SecF subunit